MAHRKEDRLWKIEDSWGKLEVYVSGYAYEPKRDQLCFDVLVRTKHFSGSYTEVFLWADVLRFARDCAALAGDIEQAQEEQVVYASGTDPRLMIRVGHAGSRKVCWRVVCQPVAGEVEVLTLRLTTEYQLLNSIRTGAERVWRRWPGPDHLRREANRTV